MRKLKGFFYRSLTALIIFGLILVLAQGKGPPARLVSRGIEYLLTRNYDLSAFAAWARSAWPRRGLEIQVSQPRPPAGNDFRLPDLPVTGRLVRGFGWQEGKDGWPRFHEGVELEVSKGALARAVLPGKVSWVAEEEQVGKIVVIAHEGEVSSLYGRLEKIGVEPGQVVAQGQVIGTVAGTLFHFELRQGNQLVDPILRLQRKP
ncbi:MAG: M23 family metallopeptidase [Bacillota bacterium]|nr:M23 family metallopeptidase [Bacillota bacterium]